MRNDESEWDDTRTVKTLRIKPNHVDDDGQTHLEWA